MGYPATVTMSGQSEQELKLQIIFDELKNGFKKLEDLAPARQQASLKELTAKMLEAKT